MGHFPHVADVLVSQGYGSYTSFYIVLQSTPLHAHIKVPGEMWPGSNDVKMLTLLYNTVRHFEFSKNAQLLYNELNN
jgi:hypothetical protein